MITSATQQACAHLKAKNWVSMEGELCATAFMQSLAATESSQKHHKNRAKASFTSLLCGHSAMPAT